MDAKGSYRFFSDNKDGEDLTNRKTLVLTHLGEVVANTWLRTPEAQAVHGNRVRVYAYVCMPDHFHGVIEVLEPMTWSLGDIIQAFKSVCTSHWQRQQGLAASVDRPISVDLKEEVMPAWLSEKAQWYANEGALIKGPIQEATAGILCTGWEEPTATFR